MTWITIADFEPAGFVSDLPSRALPPGAITSLSNMHFKNGRLAKTLGYINIYGAPTIAPYHMQHAYYSDNDPWLAYAGLNDVYSIYGNVHTKITRTLSAYGATASNLWTSSVLGGILVLNNGVDVPQYTTAHNVECQNLPTWPSSWTAASVRSYREFLIALSITEGTSDYQQVLRWSHPADPGSVPATWDDTNPNYDAGKKAFSETPGVLVDSYPMGAINMVYKSDSAYTMQYVGGQFVFSFNKAFDTGLMSRNAVADIDGTHVVLTQDDIIIHGGTSPQSIIQRRLRNEIFDSIDSGYRDRCRIAVDRANKQVLVMLPTAGNGWLNTAYVWNYKDNTWGKATLPDISAAAVGAELNSSITWDSDSGSWADDNTPWNNALAASSQLLFANAASTKIFQGNFGYQADGANYAATAERIGLGFGTDKIKLVRTVRPHFVDTVAGTSVTISIGRQMDADDDVEWVSKTLTIGSDREVWPLVRGRYISWRISMTADAPLELESLDFDIEIDGEY